MRAEAASLTVAIPLGVTPDSIIAGGWSSSGNGPPNAVLSWLDEIGGIAICLVGGFDDVESGAIVFGPAAVIKRLCDAAGT